MTDLTIGGLARAGSVRTDTIRYYERRGLIAPAGRTEAGYRLYDVQAVRRIKFIRKAQSLGFTLTEIEQLLGLGSSGGVDPKAVLTITEQKINECRGRMKNLENLMAVLSNLAASCPGEGPVSDCPILDYLYPTEAEIDQFSGAL